MRYKALVLRRITGSLALVCLGAWVGTSSVCELPLIRPVAVHIRADTAASADGLTVLAPQTVVCLRVDEAVGVDDGHDVEVELVDGSLDVGIRGVLGKQLPGHVLGGHRGDPLAGVDGAVDEHCGLRSLAARTPDVDACEDPSLD